MSVAKVDGFGVRLLGTTTQANTETRGKFVRMFASEAITKGDAVGFNFNDTEPANGYGNHVMVADTDDTTGEFNINAIGIATQAIASGDLGVIQVGGVCTFAKLVVASAAPGQLLGQAATGGSIQLIGDDVTLGLALNIKEGTNVTADSTVWLLNPANL